jgi:hypothetical protein
MLTKDKLVELAAECRTDSELSARVEAFLQDTGFRLLVDRVLEKSGPQHEHGPTADAVFAYGSIALTIMAVEALERLRGKLLQAGHPDCTAGAPCPSTGGACSDMGCPFFAGLHPIAHMDLIAKARSAAHGNDIIAFALNQGAAEA